MDLINTGTDSWILEHEACENVAREIMESLSVRETISSQSYDSLSAKIRIRLKQFSAEVTELSKKLNSANMISTLTPEERERRQRQVEILLSKEVQLKELFNQRRDISDPNLNYKPRAQLFEKTGPKMVFADMGTTSWGDVGNPDRENDTKTLEQAKQEQARLLKEQDEGLESLLKIVTAQTQIAATINNEVEHHNEILVDISDGMETVDRRINRATDLVKVINKKESIWGYWIIVFLLLIAILAVAFA